MGILDKSTNICISKYLNGESVDQLGAFPFGAKLSFMIEVPFFHGSYSAVIRIEKDGEEYRDIPFAYEDKQSCRVYSLALDTGELCEGEKDGLFFYEFLILCKDRTYFTNTENNCDFSITEQNGGRYTLLIYREGFDTPRWFSSRIMYQIFPDRFARGGNYPLRSDALLNEDWYNGIPQYAAAVGEHLDNNMFFGGTLKGIEDKLDYLKSLGVGIIYLNPIFEAYSNHKYDTGDYEKVDDMFGGDEAFKSLISAAEEKGIKIILDGVFNHTGDNSKYFNRYGKYGSFGAIQGEDSPYRKWFFIRDDGSYESWWNIDILPKLNHRNPDTRDYFVGEGGIIEKYIKEGTGGWRLDVADELNDDVLFRLRDIAKKTDPDAVIIGEVWENAAEKISYGHRRPYLRGGMLDSVMNYPFKNGVIDYLLSGDAGILYDVLVRIYATYPKCVSDCLMNILGTHDTVRILNVLAEDSGDGIPNCELAHRRLNEEQRALGKSRLKIAAVLQYTVYGIPSVYYGDEAGLEGYHDPFCRYPFPWGREDEELLAFYRMLGKIREEKVFDRGEFIPLVAKGSLLSYMRRKEGEEIIVVANGADEYHSISIKGRATELLTGEKVGCDVSVAPYSVAIYKLEK